MTYIQSFHVQRHIVYNLITEIQVRIICGKTNRFYIGDHVRNRSEKSASSLTTRNSRNFVISSLTPCVLSVTFQNTEPRTLQELMHICSWSKKSNAVKVTSDIIAKKLNFCIYNVLCHYVTYSCQCISNIYMNLKLVCVNGDILYHI